MSKPKDAPGQARPNRRHITVRKTAQVATVEIRNADGAVTREVELPNGPGIDNTIAAMAAAAGLDVVAP